MGKLRGTSAWGSVQRFTGGDPLRPKRGQPLLRLRHCGPFARGHGASDSVQSGRFGGIRALAKAEQPGLVSDRLGDGKWLWEGASARTTMDSPGAASCDSRNFLVVSIWSGVGCADATSTPCEFRIANSQA